MLKDLKNSVGDEDSTAIARLREEFHKVFDWNHVKKLLGNSLYELKKKNIKHNS